MKKLLALALAASFGIGLCHGAADTTDTLAGGMGDAANTMLSKMRGDVAGEIRRKTNLDSITARDLEETLKKLSAVSNAVASAGLNQKIESAIRQLEKSQTEAAAALKNPDSKALLQFDVQPMLLKLEWLKAQNDVLQRQLTDLSTTLQEMSAWSKIMNQVMPQEQVSAKIKSRLNQLASQWEQDGGEATKPLAPKAAVTESRWATPPAPKPEPPAEDAGSSAGLSPGANEVARMVRERKSDREIQRYIGKSNQPFTLTASQIIHLRHEGVANALIVSMIGRDQELASRAANSVIGEPRTVAKSRR